MNIPFCKYHGSGNDFVLFDAIDTPLPTLPESWLTGICDRHRGIGADGVLILHPDEEHAFALAYFNADGRPGSLCGNGSRCAVAYARHRGIFSESGWFRASDGVHRASVLHHEGRTSAVEIVLHTPEIPAETPFGTFVNTGSPHLIRISEGPLEALDVDREGAELRNDPRFAPGGTNVNFLAEVSATRWKIRTYERGVEAETLACGTGVAAAAWAMAHRHNWPFPWQTTFQTLGGDLQVRFDGRELRLSGPAVFVFAGTVPAPEPSTS